ncbi:MAG: hypothetical protein ACRETA_04475 [Gammaproteobacteria bacterium]
MSVAQKSLQRPLLALVLLAQELVQELVQGPLHLLLCLLKH